MLDYYYHNREWRQKRVKALVPKASQYVNKIRLLYSFVQNESIFSEHCSEDLRKYLLLFRFKYKQDIFEELLGICLFRRIRVNSNSLDLQTQLQGSNRCNNTNHK